MEMASTAALTLRPTMAFIKWAKSTAAGTEWVEEVNEIIREKSKQDGHIYLIPPVDMDDELDRVIEVKASELLENELMEWQIDPEKWPIRLSSGLLRQWFTLAYSELVFSMVPDPSIDLVDFLSSPPLQSKGSELAGKTPL